MAKRSIVHANGEIHSVDTEHGDVPRQAKMPMHSQAMATAPKNPAPVNGNQHHAHPNPLVAGDSAPDSGDYDQDGDEHSYG